MTMRVSVRAKSAERHTISRPLKFLTPISDLDNSTRVNPNITPLAQYPCGFRAPT